MVLRAFGPRSHQALSDVDAPRDLGLKPYPDRTLMAIWLSAMSPKLRCLLGYVSTVVDDRREMDCFLYKPPACPVLGRMLHG